MESPLAQEMSLLVLTVNPMAELVLELLSLVVDQVKPLLMWLILLITNFI